MNKHVDEKQQEMERLRKNKIKASLREQGLTVRDLKYEFHKDNKIRLMNPVPLTCLSCRTYIPKYRKFNGYKREVNQAKENRVESGYLKKIKVFELKFKCFVCSNDIVIRTDPLKAASVDGSDSLFKDDAGAGDNVKKQDGFVIVSGAERLENNDEKSEVGETNQVDRLLESISREEKLEEETRLNEMNKTGDMEAQLKKMQKQQRDDEELERMQRREVLRNMARRTLNSAESQQKVELVEPISVPVEREKHATVKMVVKPKHRKKKIVKL